MDEGVGEVPVPVVVVVVAVAEGALLVVLSEEAMAPPIAIGSLPVALRSSLTVCFLFFVILVEFSAQWDTLRDDMYVQGEGGGGMLA